tara:strand:- start:2303 stop:3364 length:1062 start_codon:yes stop_codon:yes gene_type:complete
MNRVYIELRDLAHKHDNIVLEIEPTDNQLGLMWFNALQHNLQYSYNKIEKTHMLNGWAKGAKVYNHPGIRDARALIAEMNWAIARINLDMHTKHGYPYIDMDWTIETLSDPDRFRDAANEIHHHFEILIGQVWDVSEWWKKNITNKTRQAIRWINNVVHQMEELNSPTVSWKCSMNNVVDMNDLDASKPRTAQHLFPLGQGCYKYFKRHADPLTITDYYPQLGKRHHEVMLDGDEYIDHKNISGTRYVTGEFILTLRKQSRRSNFDEWLVEHNFDPNDITQGYGYGILGEVTNCTEDNIGEIMLRNDIVKISADDGYKEISKTFDYTWRDEQEYIVNQTEGSTELREDPWFDK